MEILKEKKEDSSGIDLDRILEANSVATSSDATDYSLPKPKQASSASPRKVIVDTGDFPLKKGSKGSKVRLLQEVLITKYGKNILPKYGADGDFGSETVEALTQAGLPSTINQSTFNVLTQGSAKEGSLGKELYQATASKNYSKVISVLKQMQSTEDYTAVNEAFKTQRINGVRQTIVNGLLSTFTGEAQQQAIKFEFLRMGLQFDGSKWALSGLDGKPVVTTQPTTVWVNATQGLQVPARMVLGNEVSRKLDYTLFENRGKYFLVSTCAVQYLG